MLLNIWEKLKDIVVVINQKIDSNKKKIIPLCMLLFLLFLSVSFYCNYEYDYLSHLSQLEVNSLEYEEIDKAFDRANLIYYYKDSRIYINVFAGFIVERYCALEQYSDIKSI